MGTSDETETTRNQTTRCNNGGWGGELAVTVLTVLAVFITSLNNFWNPPSGFYQLQRFFLHLLMVVGA
jgi:hypothetical protein